MPTPSWDGSVRVRYILARSVFSSGEANSFCPKSTLDARRMALSSGMTHTYMTESERSMTVFSHSVQPEWAEQLVMIASAARILSRFLMQQR